MHWEVLIIPLIALGVWILGTIFRPEEEKSRGRPRRPGEGAGRSPQRRQTTDLDRFLEEARRRREAAERGQPPQATPRPAEPRPQPVRTPSPPRPAERRPSRAREVPPPRPAPAPRRSVEPAGAPQQTMAAPVVAEVVVVPPAVVVVPEVVPAPLPAPPPAARPAPPPAQRPRKVTPVVAQLAALLRNPQSAATAFVLSDIFGQPMCRRRR